MCTGLIYTVFHCYFCIVVVVQTYSAEETAQYEATFEANKAVMYSEGAPNKKYKQKP